LCLRAVRAQEYPSRSFETIVVLNESLERDLSFPLETGEKLVIQSENFSYAARNAGIRMAAHEIIALTDSDTVPKASWLWEGVSAIAGGFDLVAGGIELTFQRQPLTPSALYEKLFAFDQERNVKLGQSVTANLFATRKAFETYGLFAETARSGDDFDWTKAATAKGAKLKLAEGAIVQHPARETWRELARKAHRTSWYFPRTNTIQMSKNLYSRLAVKFAPSPSDSRRASMTSKERSIAKFLYFLVLSYQTVIVALLLAWLAITPGQKTKRVSNPRFRDREG